MELLQTTIKFLGHSIEDGKITRHKYTLDFTDKFPSKIIDKTQEKKSQGKNFTHSLCCR